MQAGATGCNLFVGAAFANTGECGWLLKFPETGGPACSLQIRAIRYNGAALRPRPVDAAVRTIEAGGRRSPEVRSRIVIEIRSFDSCRISLPFRAREDAPSI